MKIIVYWLSFHEPMNIVYLIVPQGSTETYCVTRISDAVKDRGCLLTGRVSPYFIAENKLNSQYDSSALVTHIGKAVYRWTAQVANLSTG